MLTLQVELRVRTQDDGKCWDDREVVATLNTAREFPSGGLMVMDIDPPLPLVPALILAARIFNPKAVELRWNYVGSTNGHYFMIGAPYMKE